MFSCSGSRHFVPGATAERIQKANTYTLTMLLLDHLKYGVIYWMLWRSPHSYKRALSQIMAFPSFLPLSHYWFLVKPHCSWLIVLALQKNLENSTLSHSGTHCNCYKRKQNNWKLLGHMKYWRVSPLVMWGSLHKQINLLPYDWHALLAT